MAIYYVNPAWSDPYEGDEMHPTIEAACIDSPPGSITELHPHKVLEPIFVVTLEHDDGTEYHQFADADFAERFLNSLSAPPASAQEK